MNPSVCVVFDVDDTLYLESDYVRSGFEAVGHWARKWLGIEDFAGRCWAKFLAGERGSIFNQVLLDAGLQPGRELVNALVELYRTHIPSIGFAPDAEKALQLLTGRAALAVITDGPAVSQSRKVEALGLDRYADPVVLTELLGAEFRKPHPKAFEFVARSTSAETFLYVADNPQKDFIAPRHLGWIAVRMKRPGGLHCDAKDVQVVPDYQISDCMQLLDILSEIK